MNESQQFLKPFVSALLSQYRHAVIVEIGTGASSVLIPILIYTARKSPDVHVQAYTIDPLNKDGRVVEISDKCKISYFKGTSFDFFQTDDIPLGGDIDIALIDGWHAYHCVRWEIEQLKTSICNHYLFHDTLEPWGHTDSDEYEHECYPSGDSDKQGVVPAIREHFPTGGIEFGPDINQYGLFYYADV